LILLSGEREICRIWGGKCRTWEAQNPAGFPPGTASCAAGTGARQIVRQ
jgi:hypothetical protein